MRYTHTNLICIDWKLKELNTKEDVEKLIKQIIEDTKRACKLALDDDEDFWLDNCYKIESFERINKAEVKED